MGRPEDSELAIRAAEIQSLPARYIELGEPMDKKAAENAVRAFGGMTNVNDGRTVTLPLAAVGKILRHKGFDFSRIIKDIPELYKTSLFGWSEVEDLKPGHKEHVNIKVFHQYVNKFTNGDGKYYIRFTVREEKGRPPQSGRSLIHSAAVSDITIYKKGGHSQRIWGIDPGEASPPPFNNGGSQRIWGIDPGATSPSSFVDRKLQEFFDRSS